MSIPRWSEDWLEKTYRNARFLGNLSTTQDYVWGKPFAEGCRYVHTLRDPYFPNDYPLDDWYHHPREFELVGLLAGGLECDLSDLDSLARSEPRGLLVACDLRPYMVRKQQKVVEVCKQLEVRGRQPGFQQVTSLTDAGGVRLTFPRLLEHLGPIKNDAYKPLLPFKSSPWSDQRYKFAEREAERLYDVDVPTSIGGDIFTFDDGAWHERLLPIYDAGLNLLSPLLYGSLINALVVVTGIVVCKADDARKEEGFYFEVRGMQVVRPGVRERVG